MMYTGYLVVSPYREVFMLKDFELAALQKIAKGVAAQFGPSCEVVIHEIRQGGAEHSIVAIENGHVTGRKVGDGSSQVVLEQLGKTIDTDAAEDHLSYLTKTPTGKLLKSSTVYIKDEAGKVAALFCINFDVTALSMAAGTLQEIAAPQDLQTTPDRISPNVNDVLDDLIEHSMRLVGKPVELMTKDDKVRAIRFLSERGALLITKSGDKIAKHFGISKYTLYSYLDQKQEEKQND